MYLLKDNSPKHIEDAYGRRISDEKIDVVPPQDRAFYTKELTGQMKQVVEEHPTSKDAKEVEGKQNLALDGLPHNPDAEVGKTKKVDPEEMKIGTGNSPSGENGPTTTQKPVELNDPNGPNGPPR